ncbi:hypothetical protein B5M09_004631 [Aphanomyces astaci]|uniref:DDE-1 domain-containing protein n=1 Tax=Aphanomyces astaci TaxID=112090 RepID=A0A425D2N1_APHAT|nr:hypothetical protein B5M09_004631 [Aphanomyces astaci]
MRMRQKYTIADRRKLLAGFDPALSSSKGYAKANGIDWGTWRSWLKKKDVIMTKRINVKKTTLGGQGRRESIPFASEMVAFMESYINNKKNDDTAYRSLLRLCQRFSTRYRYSQQVPVPTKVPQAVLAETKATFAAAFWEKFRDTAAEDIINVDETAVYYDMPPTKTLAKIGGSSKVDKDQKHSDRMTAVLSIRSNGEKLPILFIVKGQPGGTIEQNEIPTYPDGHVYVVQKKAWMDTRVWEIYLSDLLKFEINGPSVIVADNLDAHVSKDSYNRVSSELFSVLEPLPKNSTSVCQPLDVGVMGPLKSKLRSKWLHERPVVTAAQKRLAMIQRTIQVWDDIPCSVISGSFTKALPKPDL